MLQRLAATVRENWGSEGDALETALLRMQRDACAAAATVRDGEEKELATQLARFESDLSLLSP